jgi:hypothetical protein
MQEVECDPIAMFVEKPSADDLSIQLDGPVLDLRDCMENPVMFNVLPAVGVTVYSIYSVASIKPVWFQPLGAVAAPLQVNDPMEPRFA